MIHSFLYSIYSINKSEFLLTESPLSSRVEAAIQAKWSKVMGPEYEIVVS